MLKVVRLGEMDADQTVDSVREAELLANLDNEYIVKVHEDLILFFILPQYCCCFCLSVL